MSYSRGNKDYEGKAKTIYQVEGHPELIWLEFKNSLTAFNAQKKGEFEGKGKINLAISNIIFQFLKKQDIPTHCVATISDNEIVCKKLKIVPIEVVIRNYLAGSLAKKFNLPEGGRLTSPLFELYYKNDELQDPFISDQQALMFDFVDSEQQLNQIKQLSFKINKLLIQIFHQCGIKLIDFKIEYGVNQQGQLYLADEITPDSCRLWDNKSEEKLDKDRFRRDLGQVKESYLEVLKRLQQIGSR